MNTVEFGTVKQHEMVRHRVTFRLQTAYPHAQFFHSRKPFMGIHERWSHFVSLASQVNGAAGTARTVRSNGLPGAVRRGVVLCLQPQVVYRIG